MQMEAEIAEVKERLTLLEDSFEQGLWGLHMHRVTRPTVHQAILRVISTEFNVPLLELIGPEATDSGAGRPVLSTRTGELREQVVRQWLTMLLRQCCLCTQRQMKIDYRWCNQTLFSQVMAQHRAIRASREHHDRPTYRKLLRLVLEKAVEMGASETALTRQELGYLD